jgi:hypothetical protein
VEKFTFNQMNDIQIRPDVSSSDGYIGTRIVSRKPEGGINPEADNVANNDFWGTLTSSKQMPFQMRVGADVGNTVWFFAPNTQYSGLTYADRNAILVYDAACGSAGRSGTTSRSSTSCDEKRGRAKSRPHHLQVSAQKTKAMEGLVRAGSLHIVTAIANPIRWKSRIGSTPTSSSTCSTAGPS